MKHHFGDFLDREGDYWTVVPNRERYAYRIDSVPAGDEQVAVATIGSDDSMWRNVFSFPNLEGTDASQPKRRTASGYRRTVRTEKIADHTCQTERDYLHQPAVANRRTGA